MTMRNQMMLRKLRAHDCIDVSGCERTATGDYILPQFVDDIDYCDASTEQWIWSVGKVLRPLPSIMRDGSDRTLEPGTFLASVTPHFYSAGGSETIECVWLR